MAIQTYFVVVQIARNATIRTDAKSQSATVTGTKAKSLRGVATKLLHSPQHDKMPRYVFTEKEWNRAAKRASTIQTIKNRVKQEEDAFLKKEWKKRKFRD